MNKQLTALVVLAAAAIAPMSVANPSASHQSDGRWMVALAVNPHNTSIVYAGGMGGVFKSTTGGRTWTKVTTRPRLATALAIDPRRPATVYAATERGIAKTTDGGQHWRSVNAGVFEGETTLQRGRRPAQGFVNGLAVDPADPQTVYAGTEHGLLRTTNGGASWHLIGPPDVRTRGPAFAIDSRHPGRLYASYWQWMSPALLYRSTDGGDTWRQIALHLVHRALSWLVVDPHESGRLFGADSARPGLLMSDDRGAHWRIIGLRRQRIAWISADPLARANLYAVTLDGVQKSVDGGATWHPLDTGMRLSTIVSDPRRPGVVYGAGERGVVTSHDGGDTWSRGSA